jgi:putative spermidine/putrescine transport system ATP-binding protein
MDRALERAARLRSVSGTQIRLVDCSKRYPNGTLALAPLRLEIRSGETIVLLGPSGCGKTTTLRMIAGLTSPDQGGHIFFDDDDVSALPIERRNVGMVFQSYALFPDRNVARNVGYGLEVRGVPAPQRAARVAEMLALMRIEELAGRHVDALSGGQRQRVALARALAPQPRVLLLDEPLAALDAKLRETLRVEIDELLRSLGITAVYVTHDQGEAMALGDRIVVMEHGRVAQIGSPREIYLHPANRFVAEFVGSLNCLRGTVRDGMLAVPGGRIPFEHPDGEAELFFRPEDALAVTREGAGLVGRIARAHFLGDRLRLIVDGIGEGPCIIETSSDATVAVGDEIGLELRTRRSFSLKHDRRAD